MHQFNEHHHELKGFSAYYASEIFPYLSAREDERKSAVAKAKKISVLVGIAGAAMTIFAFLSQMHFKIILLFGGGTFVAISSIFAWQLKSIKTYTKEKIVGGICSYVGWRFNLEPSQPNLAHWQNLMLIPTGYNSGSVFGGKTTDFEDEISGAAHGAAFNSVEVKLTRQSGKNTVTDFHGQLMSITFPRQFFGQTIVLRDKGFWQRKKKGDMKRVGLVDPVFESIFEAYGTDQVEARYLLTPVFMQTLVDLENSVDGRNIRFGFDQNKLFIAVETNNKFEAGSMFDPLTNPSRTQKILDEIGAVYDVVDVVSSAKRG